ncbi:MAG: translocation/assembly module TamB domain-containing protein [Chthoniobacterales bacterium]
MKQKSAARVAAFKRAPQYRKSAILLLLFALLFWFLHPVVFSWAFREGLKWWGRENGLRASASHIRVKIGQPILLENFHLESDAKNSSQTQVSAGAVSLSLASPWRILFGDGRIFNRIGVKNLDGVMDFRPASLAPAYPTPAQTSEQQESTARSFLRLIPKQVKIESRKLQILVSNQSYRIEKSILFLSEEQAGSISAQQVVIDCGAIHQEFINQKGDTAWKEGSIYLSDLAITDAVRIENFTADLIRADGITLGFDLRAFAGYLRGDISFGNREGHTFIDSAFTVTNLTLDPLPEFLGVKTALSGFLREARFTFHGNPEDPFTAQASLRIAADKVRWNKRGWDAFTFSANLVEGKLVVPEFVLRQSENQVAATGEMTLPHHLSAAEFKNADYTVKGSAEIKDLSSLAALFGDPFQDASGKLSLQASIKGHGSDVSGKLTLVASNLLYHGAPAESVKIETEFVQKEAHVTNFEIHNGKDLLQAHGSLGLHAPHNYSGEITAKIADLSTYIGPFSTPANIPVYSGKVDTVWQGDGTFNSHSGAFNIKVADLKTRATPAGLSGEFKGTYSPANIYFSRLTLLHEALALSLQSTFAPSGIHLQNISFTEKNQSLAEGSLFIPLDALKLAKGSRWKECVIPTVQLYARLQTQDIAIQSIARIFGQPWPVTGNLKFTLNASGHVDTPKLQGSVQGQQVAVTTKDFTLPATDFAASLNTEEGKATATGNFTLRGFQPVTVNSVLPLHPQSDPSGSFRFLDYSAPVSGTVDFPKTALVVFQPFLHGLHNITGSISGRVDLGRTLSSPRLTGHLDLSNAAAEISSSLPQLEKVNGQITFEDDQANLRRLIGTLSGGPFDATGNADFKTPSNIHYRLQFRGAKIPLVRDPALQLRANIDLSAAGDNRGGAVNGSVRFVEGRFTRHLEITPLIPLGIEPQASAILPAFTGKIPVPFARWTLDLLLNNETPFLMAGKQARGEIIPKLRIGGTLGAPLPEGEVILNNFDAFLPLSTLNIPEGHIYFNPAMPGVPVLDIRGTTQVQGYEVHAQALGPVTDRKLILRSVPPLSQEALFLLMTTGVAPSSLPRAEFEQAVVGPRGLLLLRSVTMRFSREGATNSLINRLQGEVLPRKPEPSSLPGLRRPRTNLPFISRGELQDSYNSGIQYDFKFQ